LRPTGGSDFSIAKPTPDMQSLRAKPAFDNRRLIKGGSRQRSSRTRPEEAMRLPLIAAALFLASAASASAQVELKTYADKNGYIDVQTLTCAQLANTYQEDADLLTTWYSGWYNGLGKKHFINLDRSKEAEHEVIVYCKANPNVKIIKAIGLVFDKMRKERGITIAK
jgi:hypothetical protein